jgi:hypothetical protein
MMLAGMFLLLSFGPGFGQRQVDMAAQQQVDATAQKQADMAAPPQDMESYQAEWAATNAHQACMRHQDQGGGYSGDWAACTAYEAALAAKSAAMTQATASSLSAITDTLDAEALVRLKSPP